jgi:hypothetical protein
LKKGKQFISSPLTVREGSMNKVIESVQKISQVFDLLMGRNSSSAMEKVMAEYPFTRHMK